MDAFLIGALSAFTIGWLSRMLWVAGIALRQELHWQQPREGS